MLTPIPAFRDKKSILREMLKGRRTAAAKNRRDAAIHAARNFMNRIPFEDGAVVALYYPMKDELDTEPLAAALIERGVALALPRTPSKKAPLVFHAYAPGDALEKEKFGTLAPVEEAPTSEPDIIVTPLLGFTRKGGRLGYGGGYYDRTLKALRARKQILAVGYAYGDQEVDALPLSPLDQPLDWIVTEREAISV